MSERISSFNLRFQASPSRGPASTVHSGMAPTFALVLLSNAAFGCDSTASVVVVVVVVGVGVVVVVVPVEVDSVVTSGVALVSVESDAMFTRSLVVLLEVLLEKNCWSVSAWTVSQVFRVILVMQ